MKILVNGCSFTCNWGGQFKMISKSSVTNLARSGAGNKYIADSTICELAVSDYDLVLIMWTGLMRSDEPVDNIKFFEDYSFKTTVGTETYIFSGGISGSWSENIIANELFKGLHKFQDYRQLYHKNLLEIIKLQSYLNAKKINYYFMSYVNYWNLPKDWKTVILDISLTNFPELDYLVDEIDFSRWIFTDNNKNGFYEYACDRGELMKIDNFHPSPEAGKQWANYITNFIKDKENVDNL